MITRLELPVAEASTQPWKDPRRITLGLNLRDEDSFRVQGIVQELATWVTAGSRPAPCVLRVFETDIWFEWLPLYAAWCRGNNLSTTTPDRRVAFRVDFETLDEAISLMLIGAYFGWGVCLTQEGNSRIAAFDHDGHIWTIGGEPPATRLLFPKQPTDGPP